VDLSSMASAQAAHRAVANGPRGAFALCRPPGHHATQDQYRGSCFLNNAAVAADMFTAQAAKRVAILDIDFHHGNGTQETFHRRSAVLCASLHGDPMDMYPYYVGLADETGSGPGDDTTLYYPMAAGPPHGPWAEALAISLGGDAFKDDQIRVFKLDSPDFTDCGQQIGRIGLPTVFCMEIGYGIEQVGVNTVNVLEGFTTRDPSRLECRLDEMALSSQTRFDLGNALQTDGTVTGRRAMVVACAKGLS
jgi:acetoin utilization deacetylase AcuC-like enzyme